MNRKAFIFICLFSLILLSSEFVSAQLSAPGSSTSVETNYPVFNETDSIYIFCANAEGDEIGALRVSTQLVGTKTFLWELYNSSIASFEIYFSESSDALNSEITGLEDGCYRVSVTQGANSENYRAWALNNWTNVNANIPDSTSNCETFKMIGEFTPANLKYYDLANNSEIEIFKDMKVQWKVGQEIIAAVLSPQIYEPPSKNTDYTLRVYDNFGCEGTADVTYESIVTKAVFSVDPLAGEAPLDVNFNNQSENGDPNLFEWFLFRDLNDIKEEAENSDGQIDSIMIVAYDQNPVFTYENTGTYMVKLISKKISEFHTCADTVYLKDYIEVDSSFISVPNVFTPNGDGTNDNFVVKFWSMESIKISIFNRWGKRIHFWENNNIRGFEGTYTETVWDGRLMGGRYASPGVYFYNVVGEGRDGERRRAHGFFHLFRAKD